MKKFMFFIFLISCISSVNLYSQWVADTNGMGNQRVWALISNGNYIFAGTQLYNENYGVYASSNNGTSWTLTALNNQSINSFAVNGNNLFAGTQDNGVYLSTDNGTSWSQTSMNNQSVWSLATNGNRLYAGTRYNGVYLSKDNGMSWSQTGLNNRLVYSLLANGSNIFAGTTDSFGVYLSTNYGSNWSLTSLRNASGFTFEMSGNKIFAPTDRGLYSSTNNGTNWLLNYYNGEGFLSVATMDGINIFGGLDFGGIIVSNDSGTGGSWTARNEGLPNLQNFALIISNGYIYAGTFGNGVYRRPLSDFLGIKPISEQVPAHFALEQNYPNPFNPDTKINYQLPVSGYVKLIVYDVLGREVAVLVNEKQNPGTYQAEWNSTNFSSGVYFYKLEAGSFVETMRMILLK